MAHIYLIIFLILLSSPTLAEEVPMWEGIEKTEEMLKADRKLIDTFDRSIGRKAGAIRALDLGWKLLQNNKTEIALKRFNQAWLLDPGNPNIPWGYAMATHKQGKSLEIVEAFFKEAEKGYAGDKAALAQIMAERGRVYGERGMFQKSIKTAQKALNIDAKNEYACRVITVSAGQINDQEALELCK